MALEAFPAITPLPPEAVRVNPAAVTVNAPELFIVIGAASSPARLPEPPEVLMLPLIAPATASVTEPPAPGAVNAEPPWADTFKDVPLAFMSLIETLPPFPTPTPLVFTVRVPAFVEKGTLGDVPKTKPPLTPPVVERVNEGVVTVPAV